MSVEKVKSESLPKIVDLLSNESANFNELCDLIYHYNKSLGVTLIAIRKELTSLDQDQQDIAISNLKEVMKLFKSPNFILDFQESIDS